MRRSAQPVAIISAFLPPASSSSPSSSPSSSSSSSRPSTRPLVHSATLSSLTSISLHPIPRVAFSLQMPSRMGEALLLGLGRRGGASGHREDEEEKGHAQPQAQPQPHFVVNLLSSHQERVAGDFAKQGVKGWERERERSIKITDSASAVPSGAALEEERQSEVEGLHPLSREKLTHSRYAFHEETGEPLPLLKGGLGALACSLEGCVDLGGEGLELDTGEQVAQQGGERERGASKGSRLFIARVHAVESVGRGSEGEVKGAEEGGKPLVYWRQRFTTIRD